MTLHRHDNILRRLSSPFQFLQRPTQLTGQIQAHEPVLTFVSVAMETCNGRNRHTERMTKGKDREFLGWHHRWRLHSREMRD